MGNVLPGARALAAGVAVWLTASPAAGQPRAISWADVVGLVEEHPRLREAGSRTAAAEAGVAAAGAVPNPTLDVALGRGAPREGSGAARFEQSWELTVPLEWLAQRGPRTDVARAGVDEAKAEVGALRREVLEKLATLFWSTAFDQARVGSLEELEAQTAEVAKLVALRVEKGEARPIEVPRIETELERVRNDLAAAQAQLETHRGQLQLWVQGLASSEWRVEAGALEALPGVGEAEATLAAVREGHPLAEAGRARQRGLEAEEELERRQRLPALSVKAFASDELDRQAFGGGLGITLPVWNWNSGRIAQVEASRAAERWRLEAQLRGLQAEALEVRGACAQGQAAARRYREQILPRARSTAATLERSFQIGEATLLDVLDARRVLGETRRGHLAALLQAQLECNRLQILTGVLR